MRFDPSHPDDAEPVIELLTADFQSWYQQRHPGKGADIGSDFELLLNWKIDYGDGCLDVWTVAEVNEFVLSWYPRKVSAPPSWARSMVREVSEAFVFLGERGLLASGSDAPRALAKHTTTLAHECEQRMGDPSNFGMAKSMLSGMGVDFEDDLSELDLESLMDGFNSLPFEQRGELLGLPEDPTTTMGPILMPSAEQVSHSAAAAPVLQGFRALYDYFEPPGRTLTASGNIKLADAGDLSGILGTEATEEQFGEATFRRRSSTAMPELDHLQWWAREVGVLRQVKSRLVGNKSWRQRCDRNPADEARKAFEVLMDFGVLSSYQDHSLFLGPEIIDDTIVPILCMCLESPEPLEFTAMVDALLAICNEAGLSAGMNNEQALRNTVTTGLESALRILQRAGVVVQHDPTYAERDARRERTGGSVTLTAFGMAMIAQKAIENGVRVVTVEPPENLGASDLASVAREQAVAVDVWWGMVVRWLAVQDPRKSGLQALFEAMEPSTLVVVLLAETPQVLTDDFAEVLREAVETREPTDPMYVAASGWLVEHGLLEASAVDLDTLERARLAVLALLLEAEPESVEQRWAPGATRAELLDAIALISRLMPTKVDVLLDVIGRHHSDKVVAKTARRELLKVRSRLANQRV